MAIAERAGNLIFYRPLDVDFLTRISFLWIMIA